MREHGVMVTHRAVCSLLTSGVARMQRRSLLWEEEEWVEQESKGGKAGIPESLSSSDV